MKQIGVPPSLENAVQSIYEAVLAGRTDIFKKLIEACDNYEGGGIEERIQLLNSLITEDGTLLHTATKLGHGDVIRALLTCGADPGILDKLGNTPIQVCSSAYISSIFVEELLRAAAKSEIGRVCQLIASGVDVNAIDNPLSKNTALHWAASFSDLDTVECLLTRGADVNVQNSEGRTPLHDALIRGEDLIIETLLHHGANPHIKITNGVHKEKTAADLAKIHPKLASKFENLDFIKMGGEHEVRSSNNGSVSPLLRTNFNRRGSIESLRSIGMDSVITSADHHSVKSHLTAQSKKVDVKLPESSQNGVINFGRKSSVKSAKKRPALESTSSLEMSGIMEQVCDRLSTLHVKSKPRPLVINPVFNRLWPSPQRIFELSEKEWKIPQIISLVIDAGTVSYHQIVDVWSIHKPRLRESGVEVELNCLSGAIEVKNDQNVVVCAVSENILPSDAHYSIYVDGERGVNMTCGSLAALHHALVTFEQLIRLFSNTNGQLPLQNSDLSTNVLHSNSQSNSVDGSENKKVANQDFFIPSLTIHDHPTIANRGFMLDVSPMTRVPTLERLCHITNTLLSLKMNQLHLLFKVQSKLKPHHGGLSTRMNPNPTEIKLNLANLTGVNSDSTISYPDLRKLNSEASPKSFIQVSIPYTASELVSLDRFCADRGIQLVPGFDVENSDINKLNVLELSQSISKALVNIPSVRFIHFGPGLTSYLSTGQNLWSQLNIPNSIIPLVCANVFHKNVEALKMLPLSTVFVEYGFQADYDFTVGAQLISERGRSLAICPGTSAWSSLSGWPEAGVSNVYSGVVASVEHCASSLLIANWSSVSSFTPMAFSWPSIMVSAGLSWNHTTHCEFVQSSLGSLIEDHLIQMPKCGLGNALIELGRCETWLTLIARDQLVTDPGNLPSPDGSILYQLIFNPDGVDLEHLNPDCFSSVMRQVRKAVKIVKCDQFSNNKWPLTSLTVHELHLAMDMISTACRIGRALVTLGTNPRSSFGMAVVNPGIANIAPTIRTDLANKILALRDEFANTWLLGNNPNGLGSSLIILSSLLSRVLPEQNLIGI